MLVIAGPYVGCGEPGPGAASFAPCDEFRSSCLGEIVVTGSGCSQHTDGGWTECVIRVSGAQKGRIGISQQVVDVSEWRRSDGGYGARHEALGDPGWEVEVSVERLGFVYQPQGGLGIYPTQGETDVPEAECEQVGGLLGLAELAADLEMVCACSEASGE